MAEETGDGQRLIAALEESLAAAGLLIVSHKPKNIAHAFQNHIDPDLPASLSVNPDGDLQHQADEAWSDWTKIKTEIATYKRDPAAAEAHALLDAEFEQLDTHGYSDQSKQLGLASKLIALRRAQARARDALEPTFAVNAVVFVDEKSITMPAQQAYHIPLGISWIGMQAALTDMTNCWQARVAGYPHGYTLQHGKWMYEIRDGMKLTVLCDLATEDDYNQMRKQRREEAEGDLLIWHERLWAARQSARRMAVEERKAELARDDWVKEQGWKVWDPWAEQGGMAETVFDFGEGVLPALMQTEMESERLFGSKRKASANEAAERSVKRVRPQSQQRTE